MKILGWYKWCLWSQCDLPSHHRSHASHDAKCDFGTVDRCVSQINGTLKLEFFALIFQKFQTNLAGHDANIIWHVTVHACAKFEVIWTMLG